MYFLAAKQLEHVNDVGKAGWQAFERLKSIVRFPAVKLLHLKGTALLDEMKDPSLHMWAAHGK